MGIQNRIRVLRKIRATSYQLVLGFRSCVPNGDLLGSPSNTWPKFIAAHAQAINDAVRYITTESLALFFLLAGQAFQELLPLLSLSSQVGKEYWRPSVLLPR
jgi:hypothetical protein